MRAFVVSRYGRDGLRQAEVPPPPVGPGEVLVDVRAAGINPLDMMVRNGEFRRLLPYRPPLALGHDVAGVVVQVADDVLADEQGLRVGDEVYGRLSDLHIGSFAEQVSAPAADLARKPKSLTFTEAAAVPLVVLAAWQALVEVARVRPGQRVLVHAGAGGLGSTVVQLAHHLGAHVATTAHARDGEAVRALGADEVVDYSTTDFADVLSGFDVVLDSLGPASLQKSIGVLRPGGIAISVVGPPDPAFASQLGRPLLRPLMGALSWKVRHGAARAGVRYAFLFMHADGRRLEELARLYDDGSLRPVLDRTFDFDDTLDAVAHVEQGRAKGKVVVAR